MINQFVQSACRDSREDEVPHPLLRDYMVYNALMLLLFLANRRSATIEACVQSPGDTSESENPTCEFCSQKSGVSVA